MILGNRLGSWSGKKDNGLTHVKYRDGTKQDFDVTTISSSTIPNILDVEEIDFGVDVVSIATDAFRPATSNTVLKSARFERAVSLQSIGDSAFNGCSGLSSVIDLRNCTNFTSMGGSVLMGTGNIPDVYSPKCGFNMCYNSGVKRLHYYGETTCSQNASVSGNELTYVDLSDITRFSFSSTRTDRGVFVACPKLETIVLNPNLLGMNVTGGLCSGGSYTIDFTNTQMSNFSTYAFNSNFTGTVKLSKNVLTNFGRNSIYNCSDIKIEFPKGYLNYNFTRDGASNPSSYNSIVTFIVDPSDLGTLVMDDVKICYEDVKRKFFVKDNTTTQIYLYTSPSEFQTLTVPVSLKKGDIPQSVLENTNYIHLDLGGVKYLNYQCLYGCKIPTVDCSNVEWLGMNCLANSTTSTIQNLDNVRCTSRDIFGQNTGIVNFDWAANCEHPEKFECSGNSMFAGVTNLQSISIPNFDPSNMSFKNFFAASLNLRTIKLPWMQCPTQLKDASISSAVFGNSASNYTGYNTRTQGINKLIVPVGATGYDEMITAHPELTDIDKCGFTLQYGE